MIMKLLGAKSGIEVPREYVMMSTTVEVDFEDYEVREIEDKFGSLEAYIQNELEGERELVLQTFYSISMILGSNVLRVQQNTRNFSREHKMYHCKRYSCMEDAMESTLYGEYTVGWGRSQFQVHKPKTFIPICFWVLKDDIRYEFFFIDPCETYLYYHILPEYESNTQQEYLQRIFHDNEIVYQSSYNMHTIPYLRRFIQIKEGLPEKISEGGGTDDSMQEAEEGYESREC